MAIALSRIRTLTFVTAGGVAATNFASGSGCSSPAFRAATLRFRPQVYVGTSLRIHPPINRTDVIPKFHLHKIGIAVQPPCLDTNHPGANDTPAPVQVARIDKVSPKIAVAALPKGNVYVVRGAKIPRILTTAR